MKVGVWLIVEEELVPASLVEGFGRCRTVSVGVERHRRASDGIDRPASDLESAKYLPEIRDSGIYFAVCIRFVAGEAGEAGGPGRTGPDGAGRVADGAGEDRQVRARDPYNFRSSTFCTRWSASFRSTREARARVGRMFSMRFGSLMLVQNSSATATATSSSRRA